MFQFREKSEEKLEGSLSRTVQESNRGSSCTGLCHCRGAERARSLPKEQGEGMARQLRTRLKQDQDARRGIYPYHRENLVAGQFSTRLLTEDNSFPLKGPSTDPKQQESREDKGEPVLR